MPVDASVVSGQEFVEYICMYNDIPTYFVNILLATKDVGNAVKPLLASIYQLTSKWQSALRRDDNHDTPR